MYFGVLLSGKTQNSLEIQSAMPISRRCGWFFEKVSPLSQKRSVQEAFLCNTAVWTWIYRWNGVFNWRLSTWITCSGEVYGKVCKLMLYTTLWRPEKRSDVVFSMSDVIFPTSFVVFPTSHVVLWCRRMKMRLWFCRNCRGVWHTPGTPLLEPYSNPSP